MAFKRLAERTGIEPATSCVTGRHSNQLNYRSALRWCLAVTYSHTNVRCTTIGVTAFHFCVRNGNRWFYSTMAARRIGFKTRNLTSFSLSKVWFNLITYSRCLPGLYGQDVQIISIGKLHSSRSFHIQPINVVVCNGLYWLIVRDDSSWGLLPA